MKRLLFLSMIIALSMIQFSCGEDNSLSAEKEEIEQYLDNLNLLDNAMQTPEGIYYVINKEGVGDTYPTSTSTVTIIYTGTLLDGTIFDTSGDTTPRQFPLTNTILGWQLGIPKFKKDSEGILLIPSSLAYGDFDRPGIPGGSILRFDIELKNFVN